MASFPNDVAPEKGNYSNNLNNSQTIESEPESFPKELSPIASDNTANTQSEPVVPTKPDSNNQTKIHFSHTNFSLKPHIFIPKPNTNLFQTDANPSNSDANQSKPNVASDLAKPDVILTQPDVILLNPDASISPPDVSTNMPDVSINAHDNCKSPPDLSINTPDNNTIPPDTNTIPPDVSLITPDISKSPPDVSLVTPDTSTIPPDVGLITPDTSTIPPDVGLITPDTSTIPPDVSLITPDTSTIPPGVSLITPDTSTIPPGVSLITPDTNTIPPDVSLITPDINTIPPDVSLITPDLSKSPPDVSINTPDVNLNVQDNGRTKPDLCQPDVILPESDSSQDIQVSTAQPDVSHVTPKPIPDVSQVTSKPDVSQVTAKPDVSQVILKLIPDVSQVKPNPIPDVSQVKPNPIPDVSQVKPNPIPDVSQVKPKPIPDVSQVKPNPIPDVSQVKPNPIPDVSQVKPNPIPDVSQVKPKPIPDVSQVKPKPIPDVSQVKPKPIPDVNPIKPAGIHSNPDARESGSKSDSTKPIGARTTGSNAPKKQFSKPKPFGLGNFPPRNPPSNIKMGSPRPLNLGNKTRNTTSSEKSEIKAILKFKSVENFDEVIQRFTGKLNIPDTVSEVHISETDIELCNKIGVGVSGTVYIVKHKSSGFTMAAKKMKCNPQMEEQKRILMDLEIMSIQKSPYIVVYYGSLVCSENVWLYMELMDTCLDKLIKKHGPLPEEIVGKVVVSTLRALDYLKSVHGIIHRDVKPSNILINKNGEIKMCDFGISKQLVESRAETRGAGPTAYISPERVDIELKEYDVRADVWSLGISVIELLTGNLPYSHCISDFEVVSKILKDPAPSLPEDLQVSQQCRNFLELCLRKDFKIRPNFRDLLATSEFVKIYEKKEVDVAGWYLSLNEKK